MGRPRGCGRRSGAADDEGGDRTADAELRAWSDVTLVSGSWQGSVSVTYEPADAPEVQRALVTLVRLTIAESAYTSESAQGYSSSTDVQAQRTTRWAAWHGLLRPQRPRSMRLRGRPVNTGQVYAVSVLPLGS